MITILIFIVILGVLVFVHEFGHFITAKKGGMKVEEFGFGFPPRLVGIQKVNGKLRMVWGHKKPLDKERTVYSINWIPLGGFVKITGENNEHEDDPRSFVNRPFWARFTTLIAGVTMNVLFAWFILSLGFMAGQPSVIDSPQDVPAHARVTDVQIIVAEVLPDQPADRAGIKAGDMVLAVDGKNYANAASNELQQYILDNKGKTFEFKVKRTNQELNFSVPSIADPGPGQGPTGVALAGVARVSFPWYLAFWEGAKDTVDRMGAIISGLWNLLIKPLLSIFTGSPTGFNFQNLGGPVRIAQITGEVAGLGFIYLVQFAAFLSLNLAILNILPFPALDGGRILLLVIEKIRGKRNNQVVEQWINTLGFLALILLMVVVTAHDLSTIGSISRFFQRIF